jgi:hypothetical protein
MEPLSAALREIVREHFAVSDRGLILVFSSTLDELTQQLLRSLFVPDKKTIENLLGIDRLLGTFSSRINISFCIGAIRRDQFEDLHTFRKMRNECAHSFRSVSLSSDPLRAWNASLQQMSIAARYREEYPPGGVDFVDELSDDPRGILMKNFAHLSYGLTFRRIAARQIVIDSLVDMVRLWDQNKTLDVNPSDS